MGDVELQDLSHGHSPLQTTGSAGLAPVTSLTSSHPLPQCHNLAASQMLWSVQPWHHCPVLLSTEHPRPSGFLSQVHSGLCALSPSL